MSAAATVAILAAIAVLLLGRPTAHLARGPVSEAQPGEPPDQGLLQLLRWPLAGLATLGVWAFVGGPVGVLGGLVAGAWSVRALAAAEGPRARARRLDLARDLPAGVDLLGAVVAAGGAVEQGLSLVAEALPGALADEFGAIRHRLALGADPVAVWREVATHDELAPLGLAMVRAHESGAAVGSAIAALADELRDRARFEVESRARSVDVKSAGPLGLCLLPAFVLIGVVPMVAGIFASSGLFG